MKLIQVLGILVGTLSSIANAASYTIGLDRPAKLIIPDQTQESPQGFPLVVFLHGYSADGQGSANYFSISKASERLKIAVLIPEGSKNSQGLRFWNATPECCDFEKSKIDDSTYLANLLDEVKVSYPVNPSKIVFIGHSNGGFMSYRMACDHPSLVTGVISIAGAFFSDPSLCLNGESPNILQIHGTSDTTVPFGGANNFPSAQDTLNYWIDKNQCESPIFKPGTLDLVGYNSPGNETDSFAWNNCTNESKVALWQMNGVGHAPYFNEGWLDQALQFVLGVE